MKWSHGLAALGALAAGAMLAVPSARGADDSAELYPLAGKLVDTSAHGSAVSPQSDAQLIEAARKIARQRGLVGESAAAQSSAPAFAYGQALKIDTRRYQTRDLIAALDNALTHGDDTAAKAAILRLYETAERKPPDADVLNDLLNAARRVHQAQPRDTEQFTTRHVDDSVDVTFDRATGGLIVEVRAKNADGKPYRAVFPGEVASRPQTMGDDLELYAQPNGEPRVFTNDLSEQLRQRLNGTWTDQSGRAWEISGEGISIMLVQIYRNGHRVPYDANYSLGKITGTHAVNDPRDIGDNPPLAAWVKRVVATRFKPSFKVRLEVIPPGARLEGTWHSAYVTYSPDTKKVDDVHGRFAKPLILTRGLQSVPGAAEGDSP